MVIGLYGVPGSGKSFLINHLKKSMYSKSVFYESSEAIDSLVPGGLEAFQALGDLGKAVWRGRAIERIKKEALEKDKIAIVTGNFMFWPEEQAVGQPLYSVKDLHVFTHVIYLKTPAECIFQRNSRDQNEDRPVVSVEHLRKWQEAEIIGLRHVCFQSGILFHTLTDPASLCTSAEAVIGYCQFTETQVGQDYIVTDQVHDIHYEHGREKLETALVFDAANAFTSSDMGSLFWNAIDRILPQNASTYALKELLNGSLGYSHTALVQTALLLWEVVEDKYDALCEAVASSVEVNPEVVSLLRAAAEHPHILAVVVTEGPALVWEKVLERQGLSDTVSVLGEETSGMFVVSPISKGEIVHDLREFYHLHVWAFGQGPMDFMMLKEANEAVILVGDEEDGNSSTKFISALEGVASSYTNKTMIPVGRLGDPDFVKSVLRRRFEMVHATEKGAAKLLPFSMRNASTADTMPTESYKSVGTYLALEYVSELVGLEEHSMTGEQGQQLSRYQLRDEQWTSIVAITSKGEIMASGVKETFPSAKIIVGASVSDINHHLQHQRTVILVAPTINNGQKMMEYIEQIREIHRQIRIVVVAGIVHAKVTERVSLSKGMRSSAPLSP
ncbi:hypothetical protein CEP54_002881 [Fusarium duplospermum]|uniref:Phosphoribosyltransferase domain-containing protein n=1 Tax=Fusarium duplospermum TaxID=1325734 RepID=A0A428QSX3_9HYPO|nr:hypothetical protein CEP54_002881 [Fusarium duplospermum]